MVIWIFFPGHAGVVGNECADMLAGEAAVGEPISLDPPTVMATLTEWFNNNRVVAPSHTLDIVIEMGCKRGDGRRGDLHRSARRVSNQLLTETTLRKSLEMRSLQLWMRAACDDDDSRHK